ncbi:hypothetical protein JR316_0000060 [Psilocybe cubensis]|uniref:Uncharacterized protein n=1 Tax=Psilocybe cubensis TaxID=181762 RepID=A0ACB8HED6_PSICU|nr:hypothetical protein JR316_0000060 [Psilocybe cubensis]KAH9485997.1 hypothetical protein JR316_0000060 [Psilocybe cubensis]
MSSLRIFYGSSHVQLNGIVTTHGSNPAYSLKLSPDGRFLAIGNDVGLLEINNVDTAEISGYIHLLQFSPDGGSLAIGHGQSLSIVKDPFMFSDDLGTLEKLNLPLQSDIQNFTEYQLARGVFFASKRIVIVTFLGRKGIILGSAAISPSGERLAVMNLTDGIDFYSTTHRRLLSTTRYGLSTRNPPRNLIVDIIFIDEDTVAFGHSDGYVAFATFGIGEISRTFSIDGHRFRAPIQTITFGFVERRPFVFAIVHPFDPWIPSRDPRAINIHIGLIDNEGESGIGSDVLVTYEPAVHPVDSTSSANILHLTPTQAIILILVTIGTTIYGQAQLEWQTSTSSSVAMISTVLDPTETTQITSSSTALMGSPPTSPGHSLYAFTLSGIVTGSGALALPATRTDGVQ